MSASFDWIAFDGDDTLWENEIYYHAAKRRLIELLSEFGDPEWLAARLDEIEIANLYWYGYGIKSFTLSMIETAGSVSNGKASGKIIDGILEISHHMLDTHVALLPSAEQVLAELSELYPLLLITKGDTFEQSRKIRRTGLGEYFKHIEIVGDKTTHVYQAILKRYQISAPHFLMVGNSLRSDILPVLALGGQAVYIPYHSTWSHETVSVDELEGKEFHELTELKQLPDWLRK